MTDSDNHNDQALDHNRILAALPGSLRQVITGDATLVTLHKGQSLFEQGDTPEQAFFPLNETIVALSLRTDGRAVPVAWLDTYALAGGTLAEGRLPVMAAAHVLLAGAAIALPNETLRHLADTCATFRDALARANDALLAQLMQRTACHLRHGLEARLATALHALHAISGLPELALTQQELAELLVAQRTTVTAAATALQRRGLIDYRRGQIIVCEPDALAAAGCGCWLAVDAHRRRLFA